MVKYDKLYLITISLSSHLKIDICEDEDDNDEWTNGNLIYCNIQKKRISSCASSIKFNWIISVLLLRVPLSTCFNFFSPNPNDLLNENFIFISVTQFHLMTTREKWASNGEKCVAPTVPQYWIYFFLLMSRRTQNKKKQVKLNIEDLISQSLSYVIAPSIRGDGRENEIPPIGYFAAANILVVIELTMLCVWSTMCHVCVLSSGG